MTHSPKAGARLAATALASAALVLAGPALAQYAGSNVTGTHGVIAIDKQGNKVRFYDPISLKETKVFDAPEKAVHELTVSYDHRWAYSPLYGDGIYGANPHPNNKILVIDLEKQAIADVIDLGPNMAPHGMAATRDGKLWVVCDRSTKLLLVDPTKKAVEASYDVGGKGPHFLAILPDESKIYLSNKEADLVVFDVRRRAVAGQVPISRKGARAGEDSGSEGLTPTPDGRRLIVADNDPGALRVIDTRTDKEVARIPLVDEAPSNPKRSRLFKLMYSPDGRYLVVTSYAGGQAWVIDAKDLKKQAMVAVAKGPQGVAFAPDGRSALVSSQDSGLITKIDLGTGRAVEAVDGGVGVEVLAYY